MTKEDIIRMALEAELIYDEECSSPWMEDTNLTPFLERFAALVASAERERIKQANVPEIERVNAHIKELEDAVKEALAQPEQEPVAWRAWVSKFPQGTGSDWVYVTNPIMKDKIHNQPLYTTPPQRTWVGLTFDERLELAEDVDWAAGAYCEYAEKIEAKLKEKNT